MIATIFEKYRVGQRKGVTLLIMIVLLAAFLSISLGIINILLGQIFIIGQAGESFRALYATDIGMERTLYRDRIQNTCNSVVDPNPCNESKTFPGGSCYKVKVVVGPSVDCAGPATRCVDVTGQSTCAPATRYVEREFDIRY